MRPAIAEARHRPGPWTLLALALALPSLLPLASTALALLRPDPELIGHLWRHVLPRAASNAGLLMLLVGAGTALLGTALAALVALCEFPGRRAFRWALVLPLAMPGYVAAIAFISLLDWSGPVAGALRAAGIDAWPEFRGVPGLALVLVLVLYPYVYLVAREAFASQGARALEAARALGHGPWAAFRRASLPLARPWIAGGVLLVLMEVLADFGTAAAFNVETFATAIYRAWFALFSADTALQLAAVLLALVLALVVLEARSRRAASFADAGAGAGAAPARIVLGPAARWAAFALCAGTLALAVGLPLGRLLWFALQHLGDIDARFGRVLLNALGLAGMAAALTMLAALALALAAREHPGRLTGAAVRLATLGYGLPGALLAIGLYVPVARASAWLAVEHGIDLGLQGGLVLLLVAYGVRFTAVAHVPVASALLRVKPSLLEAAASLGVGALGRARRVAWPLLRGGLATGALLVFVDVMKEMPITLMMRPFGWDTLATRVFEFTNEGDWRRAALPALAIVLAGLVPVLALTGRRRDGA